jgi:RNA polymerase sigma-70 factor (ECF subfamily)
MARPAPTLAKDDDASLIASAARGDQRAFAAIYRRHAAYVAGVAYRLLGRDGEVDDVVQETFVAAARQLGEIRDPEHFRYWLVRVAVRNVHRRLAQRRRFSLFSREIEATAARLSDPRASAEVVALYEALSTVPPKLRIVWILRHVEGMTLPEVAEVCDASLATVKRRLADAEERVKRRLGD